MRMLRIKHYIKVYLKSLSYKLKVDTGIENASSPKTDTKYDIMSTKNIIFQ